MSDEKRIEWAKNQCFIALGNLLSHVAMLKIDSCAIGGFEAEKYDEILGLRAKNLTAAVVCPIGYRSDEDKYQTLAKVRFDKKDAIEVI
ncbi:nitroreductase family protein [Candidatus Deianiraea vastatrix]|uniref:Nitroreductase n=1 Tax=Candidatus Deianiraea vastatrix TaxID=2163644 RepID=A0A5B8XH12_9RICK|nr:nitroreductase family protein [Candidatus Deianiraea vastatrix]QED23484.1 Putative nitroreductase [Candidatus Deianiraea vastatrix]